MEILNSENAQRKLAICYKIYEQYVWLLNCYVLDFFTEDHWNKLPSSWQILLEDLSSTEIARILNYDDLLRGKVWPLSLIALKNILASSSLSRKMFSLDINNPDFTQEEKLLKLFWKNIKAKKRHEISIISKICYQAACETNCFYIIDIGSGLGHLSRMLNYGYSFQVCAIEEQKPLTCQARKLDEEFEKVLMRHYTGCLKYHETVHINMKINSDITTDEFLTVIRKAFNIDNNDFRFGIVGLHPCGDLGATLLRLYNDCIQAKYINIVGCCYMKLSTTQNESTQGFPLSHFCKMNNYHLSYHSREIACHAIENYVEKLSKGECWRLKIHTYRAVLEKLIVHKHPDYRHSALNNAKYTEDLTFEHYCKRALKKIKIAIPDDNFNSEEVAELLLQWKKVMAFYSLRLLFAPLIETIIHLDRLLYVEESEGRTAKSHMLNCAALLLIEVDDKLIVLGSSGKVTAVFDARLSPRNHVLTAKKSRIFN